MKSSQIMLDHSHRDPRSWHAWLRADTDVVKVYRRVRYAWPRFVRRFRILVYRLFDFAAPTPIVVEALPAAARKIEIERAARLRRENVRRGMRVLHGGK